MAERDSSDTSVSDEPWISWLCRLRSNKILAEVDKAFIEDAFNLYGLKLYFPNHYNKAINVLLDRIDNDAPYSDDVTEAAVELYGLIHARFIITIAGLEVMRKKYLRKDFGECPRSYCKGQAVLPVGASDEPHHGRLKMFCPKCRELYNCNECDREFDGAVFGTTFAHIFFMTYENLVPTASIKSNEKYIPRVFGFKIHASSNSLPRIGNGSSASTTSSQPIHDVNSDFDSTDNIPALNTSLNKKRSPNVSTVQHIVGANSTGDSLTGIKPDTVSGVKRNRVEATF